MDNGGDGDSGAARHWTLPGARAGSARVEGDSSPASQRRRRDDCDDRIAAGFARWTIGDHDMTEDSKNGGGLRVMIVEDDTLGGVGLLRQLQELGGTVGGEAANAAE